MRLRGLEQTNGKPSPGSAGLDLHGHGLLPRKPDHKHNANTPPPPPPPQTPPPELPSGRRTAAWFALTQSNLRAHCSTAQTSEEERLVYLPWHSFFFGCLPLGALCFAVNIGLSAVCFGMIQKNAVIGRDLCCCWATWGLANTKQEARSEFLSGK